MIGILEHWILKLKDYKIKETNLNFIAINSNLIKQLIKQHKDKYNI